MCAHDVWEPLEQALVASRDVIMSSQICVLKLQRFFTFLGRLSAERIFRGFSFLSRRIFSRIFSPDFFSSFLWEKVPRKILQENPRENPPKFIQQKSSNTFLQIAQGNTLDDRRWLPKTIKTGTSAPKPALNRGSRWAVPLNNTNLAIQGGSERDPNPPEPEITQKLLKNDPKCPPS